MNIKNLLLGLSASAILLTACSDDSEEAVVPLVLKRVDAVGLDSDGASFLEYIFVSNAIVELE